LTSRPKGLSSVQRAAGGAGGNDGALRHWQGVVPEADRAGARGRPGGGERGGGQSWEDRARASASSAQPRTQDGRRAADSDGCSEESEHSIPRLVHVKTLQGRPFKKLGDCPANLLISQGVMAKLQERRLGYHSRAGLEPGTSRFSTLRVNHYAALRTQDGRRAAMCSRRCARRTPSSVAPRESP
jgi:hypothetical protein